jgi:hypothetical protein
VHSRSKSAHSPQWGAIRPLLQKRSIRWQFHNRIPLSINGSFPRQTHQLFVYNLSAHFVCLTQQSFSLSYGPELTLNKYISQRKIEAKMALRLLWPMCGVEAKESHKNGLNRCFNFFRYIKADVVEKQRI